MRVFVVTIDLSRGYRPERDCDRAIDRPYAHPHACTPMRVRHSTPDPEDGLPSDTVIVTEPDIIEWITTRIRATDQDESRAAVSQTITMTSGPTRREEQNRTEQNDGKRSKQKNIEYNREQIISNSLCK
jgi:hypothetical protein